MRPEFVLRMQDISVRYRGYGMVPLSAVVPPDPALMVPSAGDVTKSLPLQAIEQLSWEGQCTGGRGNAAWLSYCPSVVLYRCEVLKQSRSA